MKENNHPDKEVRRGEIYEYLNTECERIPGRYVLVLSGEEREHDNFVSILFLTGTWGDGEDAVSVRFKGTMQYVHCRMVTYCAVRRLGALAGMCDPITLMRIDGKLPAYLGLCPKERQDYEKLYNDTITLIGKEGEVSPDSSGDATWKYSYLRKEDE